MKNTPLTVTLHINGKQVDTLTDEQREVMAQRLSEAMSRYYSNHPEEYKRLIENDKRNEERSIRK